MERIMVDGGGVDGRACKRFSRYHFKYVRKSITRIVNPGMVTSQGEAANYPLRGLITIGILRLLSVHQDYSLAYTKSNVLCTNTFIPIMYR